jgi:hypothetical protein
VHHVLRVKRLHLCQHMIDINEIQLKLQFQGYAIYQE